MRYLFATILFSLSFNTYADGRAISQLIHINHGLLTRIEALERNVLDLTTTAVKQKTAIKELQRYIRGLSTSAIQQSIDIECLKNSYSTEPCKNLKADTKL